MRTLDTQIKLVEQQVLEGVSLKNEYKLLTSVTGIGTILGLTIMLETGDIQRFDSPGNYASYYRCVNSIRESNGKKKGTGNRKAGNKYLSWTFSEAAHYYGAFQQPSKRFL
jgi:transposase